MWLRNLFFGIVILRAVYCFETSWSSDRTTLNDADEIDVAEGESPTLIKTDRSENEFFTESSHLSESNFESVNSECSSHVENVRYESTASKTAESSNFQSSMSETNLSNMNSELAKTVYNATGSVHISKFDSSKNVEKSSNEWMDSEGDNSSSPSTFVLGQSPISNVETASGKFENVVPVYPNSFQQQSGKLKNYENAATRESSNQENALNPLNVNGNNYIPSAEDENSFSELKDRASTRTSTASEELQSDLENLPRTSPIRTCSQPEQESIKSSNSESQNAAYDSLPSQIQMKNNKSRSRSQISNSEVSKKNRKKQSKNSSSNSSSSSSSSSESSSDEDSNQQDVLDELSERMEELIDQTENILRESREIEGKILEHPSELERYPKRFPSPNSISPEHKMIEKYEDSARPAMTTFHTEHELMHPSLIENTNLHIYEKSNSSTDHFNTLTKSTENFDVPSTENLQPHAPVFESANDLISSPGKYEPASSPEHAISASSRESPASQLTTGGKELSYQYQNSEEALTNYSGQSKESAPTQFEYRKERLSHQSDDSPKEYSSRYSAADSKESAPISESTLFPETLPHRSGALKEYSPHPLGRLATEPMPVSQSKLSQETLFHHSESSQESSLHQRTGYSEESMPLSQQKFSQGIRSESRRKPSVSFAEHSKETRELLEETSSSHYAGNSIKTKPVKETEFSQEMSAPLEEYSPHHPDHTKKLVESRLIHSSGYSKSSENIKPCKCFQKKLMEHSKKSHITDHSKELVESSEESTPLFPANSEESGAVSRSYEFSPGTSPVYPESSETYSPQHSGNSNESPEFAVETNWPHHFHRSEHPVPMFQPNSYPYDKRKLPYSFVDSPFRSRPTFRRPKPSYLRRMPYSRKYFPYPSSSFPANLHSPSTKSSTSMFPHDNGSSSHGLPYSHSPSSPSDDRTKFSKQHPYEYAADMFPRKVASPPKNLPSIERLDSNNELPLRVVNFPVSVSYDVSESEEEISCEKDESSEEAVVWPSAPVYDESQVNQELHERVSSSESQLDDELFSASEELLSVSTSVQEMSSLELPKYEMPIHDLENRRERLKPNNPLREVKPALKPSPQKEEYHVDKIQQKELSKVLPIVTEKPSINSSKLTGKYLPGYSGSLPTFVNDINTNGKAPDLGNYLSKSQSRAHTSAFISSQESFESAESDEFPFRSKQFPTNESTSEESRISIPLPHSDIEEISYDQVYHPTSESPMLHLASTSKPTTLNSVYPLSVRPKRTLLPQQLAQDKPTTPGPSLHTLHKSDEKRQSLFLLENEHQEKRVPLTTPSFVVSADVHSSKGCTAQFPNGQKLSGERSSVPISSSENHGKLPQRPPNLDIPQYSEPYSKQYPQNGQWFLQETILPSEERGSGSSEEYNSTLQPHTSPRPYPTNGSRLQHELLPPQQFVRDSGINNIRSGRKHPSYPRRMYKPPTQHQPHVTSGQALYDSADHQQEQFPPAPTVEFEYPAKPESLPLPHSSQESNNNIDFHHPGNLALQHQSCHFPDGTPAAPCIHNPTDLLSAHDYPKHSPPDSENPFACNNNPTLMPHDFNHSLPSLFWSETNKSQPPSGRGSLTPHENSGPFLGISKQFTSDTSQKHVPQYVLNEFEELYNETRSKFLKNYSLYPRNIEEVIDSLDEPLLTYNILIVGCGPGTLSALKALSEANKSILILEKGLLPPERSMSIPSRSGLLNSEYVTRNTLSVSGGIGQKILFTPNVIGGETSYDLNIWDHGALPKYHEWAQECNKWTWEKVAKYYGSLEQIDSSEDSLGKQNENPPNDSVIISFPTTETVLTKRVSRALKEVGIRESSYKADAAREVPGMMVIPMINEKPGNVLYAQKMFEQIADKSNVQIALNTEATEIIFENDRAVAVKVLTCSGNIRTIPVDGDVILGYGPVDAVKILYQSGIGDKSVLQKLQIPVQSHLPPLGKDLMVYPMYPGLCIKFPRGSLIAPWEPDYVESGYMFSGTTSLSPSAAINYFKAFLQVHDVSAPNVQLNLYAFSSQKIMLLKNYASGLFQLDEETQKYVYNLSEQNDLLFVVPQLLDTDGRGKIMMDGVEGKTATPIVDAGIFENERDLATMEKTIALVRRLSKTKTIRSMGGQLIQIPSKYCDNEGNHFSKKYNQCSIRQLSVPGLHVTGGLVMGHDKLKSVVNEELLVHGTKNVRCFSSAVIPAGLATDSAAPASMIGKYGADLLLENQPNST